MTQPSKAQETAKSWYETHKDEEYEIVSDGDGLLVRRMLPWAPQLLPPESFSDEMAHIDLFRKHAMGYTISVEPDGLQPLEEVTDIEEAGRRCQIVQACIHSRACGWPIPPTTSEFYDALRALKPTHRQRSIVSMWAHESAPQDMFLGWLQWAYSWRELVAALHRNECHRRGDLNEYVNHYRSEYFGGN